jgi:hypothetical protein
VEHEIFIFFFEAGPLENSPPQNLLIRKNIYKGRPKYLHVPNYTRDSIHDVNFWRWGPFTLYLVRVISEMNPGFHEIFIFIFMLLILYQYWSSYRKKKISIGVGGEWWCNFPPLTKLTSQTVQLSLHDFPHLVQRFAKYVIFTFLLFHKLLWFFI